MGVSTLICGGNLLSISVDSKSYLKIDIFTKFLNKISESMHIEYKPLSRSALKTTIVLNSLVEHCGKGKLPRAGFKLRPLRSVSIGI